MTQNVDAAAAAGICGNQTNSPLAKLDGIVLNETLKLVSFLCLDWFWSGLVHFQEAGGFGYSYLQDSSDLGGKSKD